MSWQTRSREGVACKGVVHARNPCIARIEVHARVRLAPCCRVCRHAVWGGTCSGVVDKRGEGRREMQRTVRFRTRPCRIAGHPLYGMQRPTRADYCLLGRAGGRQAAPQTVRTSAGRWCWCGSSCRLCGGHAVLVVVVVVGRDGSGGDDLGARRGVRDPRDVRHRPRRRACQRRVLQMQQRRLVIHDARACEATPVSRMSTGPGQTTEF